MADPSKPVVKGGEPKQSPAAIVCLVGLEAGKPQIVQTAPLVGRLLRRCPHRDDSVYACWEENPLTGSR
jgi:hypothetical protein